MDRPEERQRWMQLLHRESPRPGNRPMPAATIDHPVRPGGDASEQKLSRPNGRGTKAGEGATRTNPGLAHPLVRVGAP